MARKKVREYHAKQLVQKHANRLSKLKFAKLNCILVDCNTDLNRLVKDKKYQWLLENKLVVKPDMMFGKRGKLNLVKLNVDFKDVVTFLTDFFDNEEKQTVEVGKVNGKITHFIVEPFVKHDIEYYFSIVSLRESTQVTFSVSGGVDIETDWDDKIVQAHIPIDADLSCPEASKLFEKVPEEYLLATKQYCNCLYAIFEELDFITLETNPFTFIARDADSDEGEAEQKWLPLPLDMVVEIDDTARFKHYKTWGDLEFPDVFGRKTTEEERFVDEMDEKTGASLKLTVLNPTGRIWNLVAGGGASVIFADTVADLGYGNELGNYGEYSGAPNEQETYLYARTVIDLATRSPNDRGRALLIGGGIANFTDIAATFKGIVHALKEFKDKLKQANVRIYVRRAGPNYQAGLKLMKEVCNELALFCEIFGPEKNMTEIITMATDYIKSS